MQAYFALYWWFPTWVVNSCQISSNAFFFIIFFAQNAYLSILLGFWFFFLTWRIDFYMQECETKCFGETKKSFIILWFYFYDLFFFSGLFLLVFLEFQLFFFLSNFFVGEGVFFGLFLLLFGVGERWFFLSYISRFFKIFRFFCTFFWFCLDIFFVKPLLKNKSGKKKQNFCKYLFSSNYDLVN